MLDGGLRELDLEDAGEPLPERQLGRRLAGRTWLHELARAMEPAGGLRALLEGYRGRGLPDPTGERAQRVLQRFLGEREDRQPLSFESDWTIRLQERPTGPATDTEWGCTLLFHCDAQGYLDGCNCAVAAGGGAFAREELVAERRAQYPELMLFDLGGFAPLDPERRATFDVYLAVAEGMAYDAMAPGPTELGSGVPSLRRAGASRLPLTGAGVVADGDAPFPSWRCFERHGLRIGFVGYHEPIELGLMHEVHEPNLQGARFGLGRGELAALIAEVRGRVDLLVVGGSFPPAVLRALCEPELGVDLVLLGGLARYAHVEGGPAGFLNRTAVALDRLGSRGIEELELFISAEGRVVGVRQSGLRF